MSAKIYYLDDYRKGVHSYTPEMGDRKPKTNMEAANMHDGAHYAVYTPLELKGRGITKQPQPRWIEGSRYQIEEWQSYTVTKRAFAKLRVEYSIAMEINLD